MSDDDDILNNKIGPVDHRLARHQKLTGITLAVLFCLNFILLALIVTQLWGHPWAQESIRRLIP